MHLDLNVLGFRPANVSHRRASVRRLKGSESAVRLRQAHFVGDVRVGSRLHRCSRGLFGQSGLPLPLQNTTHATTAAVRDQPSSEHSTIVHREQKASAGRQFQLPPHVRQRMSTPLVLLLTPTPPTLTTKQRTTTSTAGHTPPLQYDTHQARVGSRFRRHELRALKPAP